MSDLDEAVQEWDEVTRRMWDSLHNLDREMRKASGTCSRCGKPLAGLAFAGQTLEQAGICICLPETDEELGEDHE